MILLGSPKFIKVWLKNLSSGKCPLHKSAVKLEETVIALLKTEEQQTKGLVNESAGLELIKNLFGPNASLRFSFKRHQALFKAISENLKGNDIRLYIKHLKDTYQNPDLEEFYP